MAPVVICLKGAGNTGKSTIIKLFTQKVFGLSKGRRGDVRAVLQHSRRKFAVGICGAGDNPEEIKNGFSFIAGYKKVQVIVCACRSTGATPRLVERYAASLGATIEWITTEPLTAPHIRSRAHRDAVRQMIRSLP